MRIMKRYLPERLLVVCLAMTALGGCNLTNEASIALDPKEELRPGEVLGFGKFTSSITR